MNKLQEAIEKLEAVEDRSEGLEQLLQMMQEKSRELGRDPSEEEAERGLKQVISQHLTHVLKRRPREEEAEEEVVWTEEMEHNMDVIRSVFDSMELNYREYVHQEGVQAFEMGLTHRGKHLQMKVYLEASPKVCRIDAIFPFQADSVFAYPLCEKMAEENYPRRFGTLQYDARDGELSYRYSFPVDYGIQEDVFRKVFLAITASAHASYDVVKQYAVGRFRRPDRDAIMCRAQELIIELDQ